MRGGTLYRQTDNGSEMALTGRTMDVVVVVVWRLQAEECETQLERLRRDEGKAVSEWQLKLEHAEKRLAHVTAARDWLEEAVVHTRERSSARGYAVHASSSNP